ncbi:hypothetical protein MMC11_000628 [Xylographa trunciseda]|nr:hypothetical protein [Xylographa trunciseda]
MAQIVYTSVTDAAGVSGTLFQGAKFWFSHRVPSRSTFIEQVKANGGEVVPLEKFADVKIVDHLRQDNAPGTISYQYIERSIRNGALEDLDDHRAGPAKNSVRPAGAIGQPTKGTRTPFTPTDDQVIYDLIDETERKGGPISGNEIYKQLGQINPRHTWQSWRERWVKILSNKPRPARVPANAPPTPPTDQPEGVTQRAPKFADMPTKIAFTTDDANALLTVAESIGNILPENEEEAWQKWAENYPHHSAHEWRNFWKANIRPVYLKRQKAEKVAKPTKPEPPVDGNVTDKSLEHKNVPHQINGGMVSSVVLPLPERPRTPVRMHLRSLSEATVDSFAEESIEPATEEDLKIVSKTTKRKRDDLAEEVPRSSPPTLQQSPYGKRRRVETGPSRQKEIPSTPERSPLSIRRHPPTPLQYNIIKLEEEDSGIEPEEDVEEDEDGDYDDLPERPASQSLSEPEQALAAMRNVFRDPQRLIDFDIAPPEGGWEEDDFQAEPDDEPEIAETMPRREDTQAILQGQTPAFDFSVPDPEEGWDLLMQPPPSSPPVPTDEAADHLTIESPEELMDEEEMIIILEKWLDIRMESGSDADDLGLALKATNNDPQLADIVLESLEMGEGVPSHIQGIWTKEDDECLEAVDARKINAVIEKHGQGGLDKRYEFLRKYNAN